MEFMIFGEIIFVVFNFLKKFEESSDYWFVCMISRTSIKTLNDGYFLLDQL
jgi:hypothetical protein